MPSPESHTSDAVARHDWGIAVPDLPVPDLPDPSDLDPSSLDPSAPRLIHLNGAPGVGKSTIAARWAGERPAALVVEIDELRVQLAGWQSDDDSRLLARELAIGLIDAHLQTGNDVIVPQFLGRLPFIERLERVAAERRAAFVEIVLTADTPTAIGRFTERHDQSIEDRVAHPAQSIAVDEVPELIDESMRLLAALEAVRPALVFVGSGGSIEATLAALEAVLGR